MRIMRSMLYVILLIVGLALPAAAQNPDGAQAATPAGAGDLDPRWLPWMGCWQLSEEQIPAAGQGNEFPARMEVCIAPAEGGAGAALTARGDGEVLMQRALVADGTRREVTEGDCNGWERRDWSADGRRMFTRAEIHCGTEPLRRMSGISLLLNRSTWVDIQGIAVEDRRHLEIRRYRPALATDEQEARLPATPRELRDAREAIARPLTLSNVREALTRAGAHVVEALLTESQPRLSLDSRTLIELDDAGVDGTVIDLLVALAYPDRFVVERRTSGGGGGGWGTGWGGFGGAYAPIYYGSAMYGMYAPWGYGGYWYDPYWSRYGYGYGRPGGIREGDAPEPVSQTRAVEGLGFTRVQPRTASPRGVSRDDGGASGGGATARARPRDGSSGGTSAAGRSGGGTRVTSGGFTRGGGGGGGGGGRSGGGARSRGGSSSGGGGGGRAVPRR